MSQEAPAHASVWPSLTTAQKKTLKAVINENGKELQSHAVSSRYGIASSSIQRALEALEIRQLVRQDLQDGATRYLLVDPFLTGWLRVERQGKIASSGD